MENIALLPLALEVILDSIILAVDPFSTNIAALIPLNSDDSVLVESPPVLLIVDPVIVALPPSLTNITLSSLLLDS